MNFLFPSIQIIGNHALGRSTFPSPKVWLCVALRAESFWSLPLLSNRSIINSLKTFHPSGLYTHYKTLSTNDPALTLTLLDK